VYFLKCGTQLPDDAAFCVKCGTSTGVNVPKPASIFTAPAVAASEVAS